MDFTELTSEPYHITAMSALPPVTTKVLQRLGLSRMVNLDRN
jgi:hypothetical protein